MAGTILLMVRIPNHSGTWWLCRKPEQHRTKVDRLIDQRRTA
jgi:hypothetical protein